jgi:Flp pilus assembly protein TadG
MVHRDPAAKHSGRITRPESVMPSMPCQPPNRESPHRPAGRSTAGSRARRKRDGGQGLVEFALILAPLMLILLGIIQFGFIFNTYVTLANATREAAREGTIYLYDRTLTKSQNDAARNTRIRTTLLGAMNGLGKTAPQFTTGSTWVVSTNGTTVTCTNGDLVVQYTLPATVTDSDPRSGWTVTVRATYHQDLVVPLIAALLPRDAGGRLVLGGDVTMVIN